MADDGADRGNHHPANAAVRVMRGEPHGGVTFAAVEQQCENAREFSGVARDVRSPDVAAADRADVRAAERFYDEQAEGDRAEEVSSHRDEQRGAERERIHFAPSTNGNVASLLYCAPDGFSTLSNRWNSDSRAAPKSYDFRASAARTRFSSAAFGSRRASVRCGEYARVSRAKPRGSSAASTAAASSARLGVACTPHQSMRGLNSLGKKPRTRKSIATGCAERIGARAARIAEMFCRSVSTRNFRVTCMDSVRTQRAARHSGFRRWASVARALRTALCKSKATKRRMDWAQALVVVGKR